MTDSKLNPGPALLVDRGSPVVYETLGAFLVLEKLEESDAARLEKVNKLVVEWLGDALTMTTTNHWPITEPFHPKQLDYIAGYATHLSPARPGKPGAAFGHAWDGLSRTDFAVSCRGGVEDGDGSPFTYRASGIIPDDNLKGFAPILILRISVPTTWPLEDFRQRVEAIVDTLRIRWATAGLAFAGSEEAFHNQYWPAVLAHARRYPGFDVEAHVPYMRQTHAKIRSINWLTFLGPELAAKTLTDVQTRLVKIQRRSGTAELQAGDSPARGDINRLDVPRAYVEADELVRKCRLSNEIRFMPPFDQRTTTEWLRRFERRTDRT